MKIKVILSILAFALYTNCHAQQKTNFDQWNSLIGEWQGSGNGQPGQGGGSFSLALNLNQKILLRKSHSEYASADNKPKVIHDDLMIVYCDMTGNPSKAIYFDNEGHTINYSIVYADKSIVLTSEKSANTPLFRLTYTLLEDEMLNTKFEMSNDGEKFITYIEGKSKKIK